MWKKSLIFFTIFLSLFCLPARIQAAEKTELSDEQEILSFPEREVSFTVQQKSARSCSLTDASSFSRPALLGVVLLLLVLSFSGTALGIFLALLWYRIHKKHRR